MGVVGLTLVVVVVGPGRVTSLSSDAPPSLSVTTRWTVSSCPQPEINPKSEQATKVERTASRFTGAPLESRNANMSGSTRSKNPGTSYSVWRT